MVYKLEEGDGRVAGLQYTKKKSHDAQFAFKFTRKDCNTKNVIQIDVEKRNLSESTESSGVSPVVYLVALAG